MTSPMPSSPGRKSFQVLTEGGAMQVSQDEMQRLVRTRIQQARISAAGSRQKMRVPINTNHNSSSNKSPLNNNQLLMKDAKSPLVDVDARQDAETVRENPNDLNLEREEGISIQTETEGTRKMSEEQMSDFVRSKIQQARQQIPTTPVPITTNPERTDTVVATSLQKGGTSTRFDDNVELKEKNFSWSSVDGNTSSSEDSMSTDGNVVPITTATTTTTPTIQSPKTKKTASPSPSPRKSYIDFSNLVARPRGSPTRSVKSPRFSKPLRTSTREDQSVNTSPFRSSRDRLHSRKSALDRALRIPSRLRARNTVNPPSRSILQSQPPFDSPKMKHASIDNSGVDQTNETEKYSLFRLSLDMANERFGEILQEAQESATQQSLFRVSTPRGGTRTLSTQEIDTFVKDTVRRAQEAAQLEIESMVSESMKEAKETAQEEIREMVRQSISRAKQRVRDDISKSTGESIPDRIQTDSNSLGTSVEEDEHQNQGLDQTDTKPLSNGNIHRYPSPSPDFMYRRNAPKDHDDDQQKSLSQSSKPSWLRHRNISLVRKEKSDLPESKREDPPEEKTHWNSFSPRQQYFPAQSKVVELGDGELGTPEGNLKGHDECITKEKCNTEPEIVDVTGRCDSYAVDENVHKSSADTSMGVEQMVQILQETSIQTPEHSSAKEQSTTTVSMNKTNEGQKSPQECLTGSSDSPNEMSEELRNLLMSGVSVADQLEHQEEPAKIKTKAIHQTVTNDIPWSESATNAATNPTALTYKGGLLVLETLNEERKLPPTNLQRLTEMSSSTVSPSKRIAAIPMEACKNNDDKGSELEKSLETREDEAIVDEALICQQGADTSSPNGSLALQTVTEENPEELSIFAQTHEEPNTMAQPKETPNSRKCSASPKRRFISTPKSEMSPRQALSPNNTSSFRSPKSGTRRGRSVTRKPRPQLSRQREDQISPERDDPSACFNHHDYSLDVSFCTALLSLGGESVRNENRVESRKPRSTPRRKEKVKVSILDPSSLLSPTNPNPHVWGQISDNIDRAADQIHETVNNAILGTSDSDTETIVHREKHFQQVGSFTFSEGMLTEMASTLHADSSSEESEESGETYPITRKRSGVCVIM